MRLRSLQAVRCVFVLAAAAAWWPVAVQAQGAARETLYVRSLAATCANCHGTNGRTAQGSTVPSVAGMPKEYMLRQLAAFRDGSRPATVMHQITKGFSEPQLEQIAAYFAAQAK
jgi:cytochrome subunit of sulfide dehydrogenase